MRNHPPLIIAIAAALFFCGPFARAQQQPAPPQQPAAPEQPVQTDPIKAMLGAWDFSNADRDRHCGVMLADDRAKLGMKLTFDATCVATFPFLKDVAGWNLAPNGFVLFVDTAGKSVLEFSEVETGLFETLRQDEGLMFLQVAAAVGPPPRPAAEVAGEWTIRRGNRTICALTLQDKAVGPDALALTVKPGCDPFVTRFGPTSWQMDRGELVLHSARGDTWRFEADDANTWHRIPERAQPVLMVRR